MQSSTQLQRLLGSFSSLMLAPNRGAKRRKGGEVEEWEGGEEWEGWSGRKGEGERFLVWGLTHLLLPHLNLRLALPRTYCGAAVHCGALTSVNMSYCLPTWQKSFPVFIHPLSSPNRCHWVTVFCASGCNGGPNGKELRISSPVLSHKRQRVLPGTTPLALLLKMLSSTPLLSNICLPPVHLKLATSVPLAVFTCAKHHAHIRLFDMGNPPIFPSKQGVWRPPKWFKSLLYCAFKVDIKIFMT